MKKNNLLKPHNSHKGAALVSILIAVAFLSIISATMLLVSVNNYEMKVTQSKSKKNFYQNEVCVNLVTAQVRNTVLNQESPDKKIKIAVGGTDTATTYKAEKIADLIEPGGTHTGSSGKCSFTTSDGYTITTFDGNIYTYDKDHPEAGKTASDYTGGSKVVLDAVKVEVENPDGFKNKIETDINFYMQMSASGGGGGTIGECSFLMDNSITVQDGKPARIQIYGNSIIGKYTYSSSEHKSLGATALNLSGNSTYSIVGDYTVIYGDIYISDRSTLNIVRGNVSVFGNIYLQDNGALLCNGNLKLGPTAKIMRGSSEITATDKSKNVIITGTITHLSAADETAVRDKLKLNDSNANNDGVLAQIIQQNNGKYFYQLMNMQGQAASGCDNFYFDGKQYTVSFYTQNDINTANMFDYKLAFLYDNGGSSLYSSNKITLDYSATNTTFISSRPLVVNNTHTVNVSQMGKAQFNYVLEHPAIAVNGYTVKNFFVSNPNAIVSEIFNKANGSSGGNPTCANTAAGYSEWSKEY